MAEFVQQRLEELLPELEQLERVQLFSKDEVRAVIKKRKEFEYRLQRKRKAKADYTRYIEYEKSVLQLIWKRRERLGYKHKQADIDHKITSRISQLYRVACIRFGDDMALFEAHAEFCRRMHQLAQGSRVFTRLLRTHGHRPRAWLAAARYELDACSSPETARALLLRALRLHPESAALWTEHFRMELAYVDTLRQRQNLLGVPGKVAEDTGEDDEDDGQDGGDDEEGDGGQSGDDDEVEGGEAGAEKTDKTPSDADKKRDAVLEGAVALAVAREAIRRLPEADPRADPCRLLTNLLAVCRQFDFAAPLEARLRAELRAAFPERALTYDTLARAALAAAGKLRERLDASCRIYEDGVASVAAGEPLWELYLGSLAEVGRAACRHRHLVLPRLDDVLARAVEARGVSEPALLSVAALYAELGLTERAAATLRSGTELHRTSAPIWTKLIQVLAASGDDSGARAAFEAAAVAVPDSAAGAGDLWRQALQWAAAAQPEYVENVFSAAATRAPAVLRPLKADYLRWLAQEKGIDAARKMYAEHHLRPPLDAEFFVAMATLERQQKPVDVARLREVHAAACRHVGKDQPGLWLEYVKFEQGSGSPELAAGVYRRAVKSLTPEAADEFVAQHARLVANVES